MRKIRAAVYTWADLLNILSEFVVANLNKVKNMFTSRYLIFDLVFFSGKFRMIINIWFKKKKSKSMIVNFYSSTPASVLCGRDGCVCVYSLYKVLFVFFLVLAWYTLSMKSL